MKSQAYTLFGTAIGHCGVAWGESGIIGVQLPEAGEQKTRARLKARFPEAKEAPPPPDVQYAIAAMKALLAGEASDLSAIVLDMDSVPPFSRFVYEVARSIPTGETLTYGEIAERVGDPTAARAVGQALGQNPFPIIVPCHRVLAAGGRTGGFSANGGITTKMRMLTIERARTSASPSLFEDLPLAAKPR